MSFSGGHLLKWALAIATYNRPDSLKKCLQFALKQSRTPDEIVIVDASNDWEISREIAQSICGPKLLYAPAKERGLTSQRNQIIKLSTSDILFLIDDDSFMHARCAEEIMKVYEADVKGCVAGVGAVLSSAPPGSTFSRNIQPAPRMPLVKRIAESFNKKFERELYAEKMLLPYDETYPDHPIPIELSHLNIGSARYFDGFRMTFRRDVICQVGFDETLKRYASAEDMDASYRASRHGVLLNAYDALIFHDKSPQERLSRHTRELLGYLNLAYLYRRNGYDPGRIIGSYRWRLLRRMAINTLRDVSKKRTSLPCARATFQALMLLSNILNSEDIENWYSNLQEQIILRNAP